MKMRSYPALLAPLLSLTALPAIASTGNDLSVVETAPRRAVLDAPTDSVIQVTFDRPVDPTSLGVDTFHAFSRGAGPLTGTLSISRDGRTVSLTPDRDASPGEPVTITIGNGLRGVDGSSLRTRGHQFRYWTRAGGGDLQFEVAQSITTRAFPGEDVIPYGGTATDLDGDGWIDLSIVNEATDDVRVFMNAGDTTCRVDAFLQPGNPVGAVPSPSEAADFDLDGRPDL